MPASRFAYVIHIRTTTETLWRALTEPEFTRQYWCQTWQDCSWTPGASWRIMAPDGRVIDSGEIVEVELERRLVLTWRHEIDPAIRAEGFSRLTYELEPKGRSTRLAVTHEIDQVDSKLIAATSTGWPVILSSLKSLIETGGPLEETSRWPASL